MIKNIWLWLCDVQFLPNPTFKEWVIDSIKIIIWLVICYLIILVIVNSLSHQGFDLFTDNRGRTHIVLPASQGE